MLLNEITSTFNRFSSHLCPRCAVTLALSAGFLSGSLFLNWSAGDFRQLSVLIKQLPDPDFRII